ncbi:MAG: TlpA family protein disulfide reductase [Bryobacteraceae bacterium]|nr:TlpA family protein disulfide reductase [Bryobacteraceae bacterium]
MKHFVLATLTLACSFVVSAAQLPRPAGELTWKLPDGKPANLSSYKGKVVVIEILSTTCPHCQDTAGMLAKMQTEFGPKGLQVIGVAVNDDANVPDFASRFAVRFPVGKGDRDAALGFLQQSVMRSFYYPGLVFVDRNGMIQAQHSGNDAFVQSNEELNIRNQIVKMIGTATPTTTKASNPAKRKAS